jgi:hypothetical protein
LLFTTIKNKKTKTRIRIKGWNLIKETGRRKPRKANELKNIKEKPKEQAASFGPSQEV